MKILTIQQRKILREFQKRYASKPTLRHPSFSAQSNAIDDQSKRRAWNATRRGAKSTSAGIDIIETMEKFPRMKNLYLALTLDSARGILWDELKWMAEKLQSPITFNEARTIATHTNGSSIRLFGVDASEKEMRKVLGQKYKKVFIDEAGSMTINMVRLCYQMLEPALIDLDGQLTLLGTCENIPQTFFEKVTMGQEPGWSIHRWTSDKNPYVADKWLAEKNRLVNENPNVVHASWFRTHYLNEWCQDDDLLIIPFDRSRNEVESIPSGIDFHYVLGVDLGFNDATSFNILAFSPDHPICYRVSGWKEKGLILSRVGEQIHSLREKYEFFKIVIDGANKQGVEDLKQRFNLPLVNAEKTGKPTYLKAMKDDILTGNLKAVKGQNESWIAETQHLQWSDNTHLKEDPRCENHENDGTLYAWRECRHYRYEAPKPEHKFNSDEYHKELERKLAEELTQKLEEQQWTVSNLMPY